uniref:Ubiquitin carboxyl-terminal hydrolase MINDY-4 n=1 Tax=Sphaerodactylus townsendi TaxID=933632 RepID=A0ACB8FVM5_9SAUR
MFVRTVFPKFQIGGDVIAVEKVFPVESLHRDSSQQRIRGDFDVITNQLIGAHGYCTQELVNLLLTGKAVSNVFNDVVELDSGNGNTTALKGISGRSDIGLLSLFEHYDVCQCGQRSRRFVSIERRSRALRRLC